MKQLLSLTLLFTIRLAFAQDYNSEVALLHDNYERGKFLASAFELYEGTHSYEDSVIRVSSFRSEAHSLALDSLREVDSLLTTQIDQYLIHYGYPSREEFGELLSLTPYYILLHSRFPEIQDKHFNRLYEAYEDGDLEQRRLIGFLEKRYEDRFQKNFQSYTVEEERLHELMRNLGYGKTQARRDFFDRFR